MSSLFGAYIIAGLFGLITDLVTADFENPNDLWKVCLFTLGLNIVWPILLVIDLVVFIKPDHETRIGDFHFKLKENGND